MGVFDRMLKDNESLFLDSMPLDPDFQPPIIKYRENEQAHIATCIKPLFHQRSGKNLVITGAPGLGKTAAIKHLLSELNKESSEITTIYINCWKKDTSHKIALDLCDQLNFRFVTNRDTSELFQEIRKILNKQPVVIVLDEADKITDQQAIYTLLEDIYTRTIIFITNEHNWLSKLDERVRSRIMAEILEFRQYTYDEIRGILEQRVSYALVPNVLEEEAFTSIVDKTADVGDVRVGLFLIKQAAEEAESAANRKITITHTATALKKLEDFHRKSIGKLNEEEQFILSLIKQHSGSSTKHIFSVYQQAGGTQAYTTFQRKMKQLLSAKFITIEEIKLKRGRTTKVTYGSISEGLGNYF